MKIVNFALILISLNYCEAGFQDYLNVLGNYFSHKEKENELPSNSMQKIPYEVATADEKFIQEASQLTGIALSELDSCQQRVVLKLKSDCHQLNDEQLAKMAVALLNCQSYVEGRRIFPCSAEMSIKDCTSQMDSDTWTSYHLMSNRARAVCYSIRQVQFRGLAEHTVNRLMEAAQNQLITLDKIQHNQANIKDLAEDTYEALIKGHDNLAEQQNDIQQAQLHELSMLDKNIVRLYEEKKLILETHNDLVGMTKVIHKKLENYVQQLDEQKVETKATHQELIQDILEIQKKAQIIFQKIEESSQLIIKQNRNFEEHYMATLKNLAEVNNTVHNLLGLVSGTRQALEERLNWVTKALGGTDLAVERLYLVIWHLLFLLMSMLTCAFLNGNSAIRLAVTILPPINLAAAFYDKKRSLDPLSLTLLLIGFICIQKIIVWSLTMKKNSSKANLAIAHREQTSISHKTTNCTPETEEDSNKSTTSDVFNYDDFNRAFTPPLSCIDSYSRSNTPSIINKSLRSSCNAKTRMGTPCKLSSLPGKTFCYRHERGDSMIR